MQTGQAEALMPMLSDLLQEAGMAWSDLTLIGVGTGPGNFTGIRIAVSAARGLALGLGIPAIGVTAFDAAGFGAPRPVTIRLPAPRGQVYVQELTETSASAPALEPGTADALPVDAMVTAIARIAAGRGGQSQPRPAPLYVRAADAAPARDPAPRIIPD
jgi:tRNA threonylcarbamoyladenosine biosynthesis protein TsaB